MLPLLAALATIAGSLLALDALARVVAISEFAVNVVTLLGLGLAVDYSLLVIARFREERGATPDAPVSDVLARTIAGAGRAVLVSGLAVAIALAGLYVFADPLLSAMALGGVLAVGTATIAGLTLVPALIAVAHHRIPSPGTRTWVWRRDRPSAPGLLARLAAFAQRRPAAVALTVIAALLALSIPVLGLQVADADARSLPADAQERRVLEAVERDFTAGPVDPIQVLIAAAQTDPAVTGADRQDAPAAERQGRDAQGRSAAVGHRHRGRRRGPRLRRTRAAARPRDPAPRLPGAGARRRRGRRARGRQGLHGAAAAAGPAGRRPADGAAAVRPHALRADRR